jgi:pimeloyl-ACP methyl ester carboxylesterase
MRDEFSVTVPAILPANSARLELRDGRFIGFAEFGDPAGRPVVFCHGFPASRLDGRLGEAAATRLGVRLIAPDRPGYGLSSFQPGRRMSDWPRDVAELADRLALDRFAVMGISGGGPYALACAASFPDRVSAIGVVAGLGRVDIAGNTSRMNSFARFSFALARGFPVLSQLFNRALAPMLRDSPRRTTRMLASQLPPPDQKVMSDPEVFARYSASYREGFRQGGRGPALDMTLYARPWDFTIASIRAPFYLWHGDQDTTVPVAMGKWLAGEVPGCRATFYPDEGHFSLPANRMDEMLGALAPAAFSRMMPAPSE